MPDTAQLAVFHGTGTPFEIREYPVPEPEPGAILVKIALANVCGSDMHYWRGEQDYKKMGRPLPLNTGHEHVGTVAFLAMAAALGAGSGATFALVAKVTDPSRVGGVTGLVGAERSCISSYA